MPPAREGKVVSQVLGLELRLEAGRLRVVNPATEERLLTPAEALAARGQKPPPGKPPKPG